MTITDERLDELERDNRNGDIDPLSSQHLIAALLAELRAYRQILNAIGHHENRNVLIYLGDESRTYIDPEQIQRWITNATQRHTVASGMRS